MFTELISYFDKKWKKNSLQSPAANTVWRAMPAFDLAETTQVKEIILTLELAN